MENVTRERAMVPVASSNVRAVGYEDGVLTVQFRNGGLYRYFGISPDLYHALLRAPSTGKFLHAHVKGTYRYERVGVQG